MLNVNTIFLIINKLWLKFICSLTKQLSNYLIYYYIQYKLNIHDILNQCYGFISLNYIVNDKLLR